MRHDDGADDLAGHSEAFKIDPISQFEIERLIPIHIGNLDASFTNAAVSMGLAVLLASAFLILSMRQRALVPGRFQSMGEIAYEFVSGMMHDTIGHGGKPFFPLVFSLFMFVLFCNFLGLVPYELPLGSFHGFTATSHIIVTFALASVVFLLVVLVGLIKHGAHFFSLFVPKGVPVVLLPLIVLIELISFLTRPLSLSVRLFANMTAGHTMLKVFAGFIVMMGLSHSAIGYAGATLPLLFSVAITGLEFLVAFLQAYVFAVLTCIYLNDAIHLHDH